MIFLTSDTHFGHKSIIKYCGRPFSSVEEMDATIISNWNAVVTKKSDIVYVLGDFAFRSTPPDALNGTIIRLKGNHDHETLITQATINFGGVEVFLTHFPPETVHAVPETSSLVLCGHVHEKWQAQLLDYPEDSGRIIPMINVGVDVWGFKPISIQQIITFCHKSFGNNPEDPWCKVNPFKEKP